VEKQQDETIPTWVRESSEKKPKRAEWSESKLQWRKETKKSQRSFSKNKERDYTKLKSESVPSDARGGFRNTFDKAATYEGETRRSSWDPKSKKPGTGFEKSKTGYKWVGSAWDKSTAPRVSTRTWDDIGDKPARSTDTPKRAYTKWTPEKNAPSKVAKEEYKKPKYIAPKPTWEKEMEVIDKKKLVDPTK
jgi:beta-glucanase (GH16 family)